MRTHRLLAAAALSLLLPLSACSGGSDSDAGAGSSGGDMFVVSCSLGCTNGLGGDQVFCSIVNTFQNQELSILFSEPIDLFSVNTSSFRVVNVANGTSPSGQFFLDPLEPRRLIFRPSLAFDDNGNPIFGFQENTSYQITIPGTAQGDGPPFIQSQGGRSNLGRLQCTILTSEGIIDPVPGAPQVKIFVSRVVSYDGDGNPSEIENDVIATKDPELIDVYRDTSIQFEFNDIMNVATLLNPSTGQAPFILIEIDDDGTLATLNDRVAVDGTFLFSVDQESLETFLSFTPILPFPSAGQGAPFSPRRIAITVPSSVQDLVSNPVLPDVGGGTTGMVPELSQFGETVLPPGGEEFTDSSNEDVRRSGAVWGGGRLAAGVTGGAGQLGDLVVPTGSSIVLNTDSQSFPLNLADGTPVPFAPDIMGNPDPAGGGDPGQVDDAADFPSSATITDGGFQFSVVEVEPGGSLRLEGSNAGRLWSRGTSRVQAGGEIDLVGVTPEPIDSNAVVNPKDEIPVAVNAANGAAGGFGGSRFDMSVNAAMLGLSEPESDALANPDAHPDGYKGEGVGGSNKGGGPPGAQWPTRYPTSDLSTNPATNNNHGVTFNVSQANDFGQSDTRCRSLIVGQAGGGGAYATDGGVGHAESINNTAQFPNGASNTPPDTPGGDSSELGLAPPDENSTNYFFRKLKWPLGHLRGGSGGGGGGNHPYGTWVTGYDGVSTEDCINSNPVFSRFRAWHDHSGAQGGYGGGALHWVSGRKVVIDGTVDLRGGDGGAPRGQGLPGPGPDHDFGWYAMPGGGGSGGALRIVAREIDIADVDGRIDIRGGTGGTGFVTQTKGGDGGTGLIRLEDEVGNIDRAQIADDVFPFDSNDNSLSWISVAPGDLTGIPRQRPDSMSASTSCWMRPEGNFFGLGFVEDEDNEDTGDPNLMGWNMTVIWDDGTGEVQIPFRGDNDVFMGSFENEFGKLLGYDLGVGESAAPLAVRFQGVRVTGTPDLCDLDLNDPNTGVVNGSLTPWVDHPALLNTFNPVPNAVRFAIVFDGTVDGANNDLPGLLLQNIKGVTDVRIRVLPD